MADDKEGKSIGQLVLRLDRKAIGEYDTTQTSVWKQAI
jgi:hypothetical protein